MKILKVVIGLMVAILAFAGIGYFVMSDSVHMERSITINASAEQIYSQLISYKRFNEWSPWARIDPGTQYEYSGPESGVGAKMVWTSDHPDVGNGGQEILEAVENQKIVNKMLFEGFSGDHTADVLLEEEGDATKVTWTYDAKNVTGIGRFMLMGIDKFLGPSYEQGLQSLKEMIESTEFEVEIHEPVEMDSTSTAEGDSLEVLNEIE